MPGWVVSFFRPDPALVETAHKRKVKGGVIRCLRNAQRRNEIKRDEPKLKFIIKVGAQKLKQKTAGEDNEIEREKYGKKEPKTG